jgi:hypothetical protein
MIKTRIIIGIALIIISFAILFQKGLFSIDQDYTQEARFIKEECQTNKNKEKCYKEAFKSLTVKNGFWAGTEVLLALQSLDQDATRCHNLAHTISETAVKENPKGWKKLINGADLRMEACAGGFLHGIVEGYMAANRDFVVNPDFIAQACDQSDRIAATACAHGFGHILLFQTNNDLKAAGKICEPTDSLASECYKGLFMEDASRTLLFEHGLVSEPQNLAKDPNWLEETQGDCQDFSDNKVASEACWANLGQLLPEFYQYDPDKVYETCNNAPSEGERRRCYFLAISSLSIMPKFMDEDNLLRLCQPYRADYDPYDKCIKYIATTLVYHSLKFADLAVALCNRGREAMQEECFKALGAMLARIANASERPAVCKNVPVKYKDFCLAGNSDNDNLFQVL